MPQRVPIPSCLLLAFAVMLSALIATANTVLPRIVQGELAAAKTFRDFVGKSTEISPVTTIVGYRRDLTESNRPASLPPIPELPVVKSFPLSFDEQRALTNLLVHARPGNGERGEQVGQFQLKQARGSKTLYVWCHGDDALLFRVFDNEHQAFLTPDTELACPGLTRFVEGILDSAVRTEENRGPRPSLNPQGAAEGRQPSASGTNRTSAAADSRRSP